jgi:hypothetical protein
VESSPEFARFIAQRARLNERLATTGAQLDEMLNEHESGHYALGELAALEGILATRRDLLSELARLDDSFVNYLLSLRSANGPGPAQP